MKGHLDVVVLNFALLHNLQKSMNHSGYSTEFRVMTVLTCSLRGNDAEKNSSVHKHRRHYHSYHASENL